MLLDKELRLSNAQAVTASAKSTNTIDLGANSWAGNSNGARPSIGLLLEVDESAAAAGAATVTFQVRSSANADMTGAVVHAQSRAVPIANLTAGAEVPFKPDIPEDANRYVDIYYEVGTGPLTAGKFSAVGIADRQTNR